MSPASVPTRWLAAAGTVAEIDEDAFIEGALILSIGGAQQSHVNLRAPDQVFYEYLRRIANVLDLLRPPGEPLKVLHLGAGALTLVRYVEATRPGSEQAAAESERELLDFVLQYMPLTPGTRCELILDDARAAAGTMAPGSFDAVVLDIFAGADAPGHLANSAFYGELLRTVGPDGVVLVNVGDDPPLAFARQQSSELSSVAADGAALADREMFSGSHPGNIVLAATNREWPAEWTDRLLAAGPHPAAVLTGADLRIFQAGA
ncbi:hypothetical protein IWX75_001991 [Arthrobacter sp. CAN_A6]|uniref:spermidine synthase n=1 Tax=Arthrobacter sp. CAN_A6 TaxID=2787721 RepID=UPI0018CBC638